MSGGVIALAGSVVLLLPLTACDEGARMRPYVVATGGNARHGEQLIQNYGCGACHVVPGVHAARGLVGPPLYFLGQRTMIAGELPNSPANRVVGHFKLTHYRKSGVLDSASAFGRTEDCHA
jgi:cytochrome c2